jgi:hypothetical protein
VTEKGKPIFARLKNGLIFVGDIHVNETSFLQNEIQSERVFFKSEHCGVPHPGTVAIYLKN